MTHDTGTPPEDVELAGWPMPFARVTIDGTGKELVADAGGNLSQCVEGSISASLSGPYVDLGDDCGTIGLTALGDLDFGVSPNGGSYCTTPDAGGEGNTRGARTAFYHLNRLQNIARNHLPDNLWAASPVPVRSNFGFAICSSLLSSTSTIWLGVSSACTSHAELPGMVARTWRQSLDENDATPGLSSPAEGLAEGLAALYTADSCIGRGMRTTLCTGNGDPCTECNGWIDVDWAARQSGQPHDLAFIDASCGGGSGPCGGDPRCEGIVVAEAVWDLFAHDLPALYGMDANAALEVATRLTFVGGDRVGQWFQCENGTANGDGCNADSGYLGFLEADDDDGDLLNGTPHMEAIFAAFDRHGIACPTPFVQTGGCAGRPSLAPLVSATPLDRGALLEWSPVPGATQYRILRGEGVAACEAGKVLAGVTGSTSFSDEGLQNGRQYTYTVLPVAGHQSCVGPASPCTTVAPEAGPNLAVDSSSCTFEILTGDGDPFLDNCERARVCCDFTNLGAVPLTDVKIASIEVLEGAVQAVAGLGTVVARSVAPCGTGQACFEVRADGVGVDDMLRVRLGLTSAEMAPRTKSGEARYRFTEGDFVPFVSRTFTFEDGLEDWQLIRGTFQRRTDGPGSGGGGTDTFIESSAFQGDSCDQIRSPQLLLSPTSTLSLATSFDIPPFLGGFPIWFGRANLGLVDAESLDRTVVVPDGGRPYNVFVEGAACFGSRPGWQGTFTTWAESNWSPTALGSGAPPEERLVYLDVLYGVDIDTHRGLWFDEVTLTDFELRVPDSQSDVCLPGVPLFSDGFESGSTAAWTLEVAGVVGE